MIALWIAYCLFISLTLALAALAAERGLRCYGRALRWPWVAAIMGSIGLPVAALGLPAWRGLPKEPLQPALYTVIEGVTLAAGSLSTVQPTRAALVGIDGIVIALWVLASVMLVAYFVRSYVRLRSESKAWSQREFGARTVLVSRDRGPAVTGFFRSAIVLPSWVWDLEEEIKRIILLHEEEHLRAGDHRLLGLGLASLVLAPWNLPLWWQVRRLRLAIELDCDSRVLQRGAHPHVYGNLLLEVSRRAPGISFLPTTFSEGKAFLERRVENMTRGTPNRRIWKAILAAGFAGALLALACETPTPEGPTEQSQTENPVESLAPAPADLDQLRESPRFTPYTQRPEIKDGEEALQALLRHYPEMLKRAGIGGTVFVWMFVEADGMVGNALLRETSGNEALDAAALAAAREFEFTPAINLDETVPVWVAFPIVFQAEHGQTEQTPAESAETSLAKPPADLDQLRESPRFTPYTKRPEIKDGQAARDAVARRYPEVLKRNGIGGTVIVWMFIEADGTVGNAQVRESSGNEALDAAAMAAAREIEFIPARNNGEVVPAWVAFPILFEAPGQPDEQVSIIQGVPMPQPATVNSGQEPLIIVDGVVVSDEFDFDDVMADLHARGIDRVHIQSIEVVKGSAAAALYGSRANNGVIRITTKRGAGQAQELKESPFVAPERTLLPPPAVELAPPGSAEHQEPLVIVDGVVFAPEGVDDLRAEIDKLDIESIEVIKSAAAQALYGSRAANGVIQITTKRGG